MDDLYLKERFENRNILYIFNKDIVEYDIKSAGINVTKEFGLLPDETIKYLESLPKSRRVVEEGNLKRKNPEFSKKQSQGLAECRRLFMEANKLERDDIISVRKDAIWTIKPCRFTEFGKNIKFTEKQRFTSFVRLGKRIEVFYSPMKMHVSGIDKDLVKKHESYILNFMNRWFQKMETEDPEDVIAFTRRFIDKYKRYDLDLGYYRRFDVDSKYVTLTGEKYDEYWEDKKYDIYILDNFYDVLIRLIKIPL